MSGCKSLGLYVHIPFCLKKCPYCDFVSYSLQGCGSEGEKAVELYLQSLLEEAVLYRRDYGEYLNNRKMKTLYIGGGTPTCLSGGQLFVLLDTLQKVFELDKEAEITVEANPGTLDRPKLESLKRAGCSRLSLGVQSFARGDLKLLGRIHSPQEVYKAYELARVTGFTNINLDLMYGLPAQTVEAWEKNLRLAVDLAPEHLSLYQLNIEKGTPFYKKQKEGIVLEADQETARQMLAKTMDYSTKKGYRHYEISNFAKAGGESRHNKLYWLNQEYVGLGAGASGYLNGVRYSNETDLSIYKEAILQGKRPAAEKEAIDRKMAMSEQMFLGLRLLEGVDKRFFYERFGVKPESTYGSEIERLKKEGLLTESSTHLGLTERGVFLANTVFMEFVN